MSGQGSGFDFNTLYNQADPMLLLLQNSVETQNSETMLQGSVSNVVEDWSTGAEHAISNGDNILSGLVTAMSGLTASGDAGKMSVANAKYQVAQTGLSTLNSQYSNIEQGGLTSDTNLTNAGAQNVQYMTVATDYQMNMVNLIGGYSSK